MDKIYTAFLIFLSYFIVTTFIPKNADSASKQSTTKVSEKSGIIETALFAGGCFWCMEHPFENQPGISKALSGYTGGEKQNPTYNQVASGLTQHVEAVEIHFDPEIISYNDLLQIFWRNIDPTDAGGQFVDRGKQYTAGIFYKNNQQKKSAEQSKARLEVKICSIKQSSQKSFRQENFILQKNTIRIFSRKTIFVIEYTVRDLGEMNS